MSNKSEYFLKFIIWERMVKGILLILISVKGMSLLNRDLHQVVDQLISQFNLDVDRSVIAITLKKARMINGHLLFIISVALFLYGVLDLVEAYGLYLRKRWAEYLTVFATALFIPFEIYEVLEKITLIRSGALILNILIVIFLIRHKELFPNTPLLGKKRLVQGAER
ncbi:MAG: DUF2127 domain-containing protein [Nitrospirae bacterium]|nr:DUF2127 domain-containing protein [Nitrospirota bacterium]MBI3595445.1 DUF2127 domain-containing protein [Nitrospirota bacterium]